MTEAPATHRHAQSIRDQAATETFLERAVRIVGLDRRLRARIAALQTELAAMEQQCQQAGALGLLALAQQDYLQQLSRFLGGSKANGRQFDEYLDARKEAGTLRRENLRLKDQLEAANRANDGMRGAWRSYVEKQDPTAGDLE